MPWSTTRPAGTQAKYRTAEHRRERAKLQRQMDRDGYLVCAQPVCIEASRVIMPSDPWHTGHDDTGTVYIGPTHATCGVKDGAKRGRARVGRPQRWEI